MKISVVGELTPIQKFITKLIQGEPLDEIRKDIRIVDGLGESDGWNFSVGYVSEYDFYSKLVSEGRLKLDGPPANAKHILWAKGRRSGATTLLNNLDTDPSKTGPSATIYLNKSRKDRTQPYEFTYGEAKNGLRGGNWKSVRFDEAAFHQKGVVVDLLKLITPTDASIAMFSNPNPNDNTFKDLFFKGRKGMWRVRTASWEGTYIPLDDILKHRNQPNFNVEFGYGW